MKICKDCKWYVPGNGLNPVCSSPHGLRTDLVTGERVKEIKSCSVHRGEYQPETIEKLGLCGPLGRFFEKRVTP